MATERLHQPAVQRVPEPDGLVHAPRGQDTAVGTEVQRTDDALVAREPLEEPGVRGVPDQNRVAPTSRAGRGDPPPVGAVGGGLVPTSLALEAKHLLMAQRLDIGPLPVAQRRRALLQVVFGPGWVVGLELAVG